MWRCNCNGHRFDRFISRHENRRISISVQIHRCGRFYRAWLNRGLKKYGTREIYGYFHSTEQYLLHCFILSLAVYFFLLILYGVYDAKKFFSSSLNTFEQCSPTVLHTLVHASIRKLYYPLEKRRPPIAKTCCSTWTKKLETLPEVCFRDSHAVCVLVTELTFPLTHPPVFVLEFLPFLGYNLHDELILGGVAVLTDCHNAQMMITLVFSRRHAQKSGRRAVPVQPSWKMIATDRRAYLTNY